MDFALLSDGKSCFVGWGDSKRSSEPLKNAFYINNFDLKVEQPWYQFEHTKSFELRDVSEPTDTLESILKELPLSQSWELPDYEPFRESFSEATEAFRNGLRKVLISSCDRADREDSSLYQKLKKLPKLPYYFFAFKLSGKGVWGLSPELLFEQNEKEKTLKTMALAGTYAQESEARHQPEHQAVLDFFKDLASSLGCLIHVNNIVPSSYGKIKHLKSEILFEKIPDKSLNEWVRDFHPTPALGVSPRNAETLGFLKNMRTTVPEYFGAPFGFSSQEFTRMIVMIRGVFFDEKNLYRPIGVGVTAASSLEAEWREVSLKRLAMEDLWNQLT